MLTSEEIKLRLFESIAANSKDLTESGRYMTPDNVARNVNSVYNILFKMEE